MSILKIALMQIAPCGSLDGNLKKGLECCEKRRRWVPTLRTFHAYAI